MSLEDNTVPAENDKATENKNCKKNKAKTKKT